MFHKCVSLRQWQRVYIKWLKCEPGSRQRSTATVALGIVTTPPIPFFRGLRRGASGKASKKELFIIGFVPRAAVASLLCHWAVIPRPCRTPVRLPPLGWLTYSPFAPLL